MDKVQIKSSLLSNTISPDAFWPTNKKLTNYFQCPLMANYLACLIGWRDYFDKRGTLESDGSFYTTREKIEEELFIKEKKQTRMLSILIQDKIVSVKMKGIPPKQFKIINDKRIESILSKPLTFGSKRLELQSQNGLDNNKNKLNKNTSKRSIKATTKKRSVIISSFAIDCIDIWNAIPYVRQHKNPNTKVYFEIDKYIDQMIKGTFVKDKMFDTDWMKRRKMSTEYMGRRFSRRQIITGIRNVALMFKEGYFPQNKKSLPKSLPSLMYNSRTGTSLFISVIDDCPQPLLKKRDVTDKNPTYTNLFKKYLSLGDDIDSRDLVKLVSGIESILEFRKKIPERSFIFSVQAERQFGSNLSICKTYIEWMVANDDWLEPHVAVVGTDNKLFDKFISEKEKELYGYKLR